MIPKIAFVAKLCSLVKTKHMPHKDAFGRQWLWDGDGNAVPWGTGRARPWPRVEGVASSSAQDHRHCAEMGTIMHPVHYEGH